MSSAVSITGSSSANTITGGSGNDTIDGASGSDVIAAGGGNDTVTYRGTETSIDGGTGTDTLILAVAGGTTAINLAVAAGSDQTTGDSVSITNFESIDASALSSALTVTGSASANTITTGSGNDTIDGGGGADVIAAGAGTDTVTYRGTETSIDGGTGTNTLVMQAATTVNLGNADQTTGDSTAVNNFQNVDASALFSAVSITGSAAANIDHRRVGQRHHRRRGWRGRSCSRRRQRQRLVLRHGNVDRRWLGHQHAGAEGRRHD